ncbi:MAG: two-component regulator propeller domain-containing protein, partial [Bacteroidia bacterium]
VNTYRSDDSALVIATEKNGLITSRKNHVHLQNYNSSIAAPSVNALFRDGTGNFWLCSQKGLHLLYHKRYEFLNAASGLKNSQVTAIAAGENGTLWIGTQSGVQKITRTDAGDVLVTNEGRISGITISCIAKNPDGSIWFGTYSNGIEVLYPSTGRLLTLNSKAGGLPNDNISTICFEKDRVYISTLGGGLIEAEAKLEGNGNLKIKKIYTENDGLGSNYVYASITDASGNLYAASDGGGLEVRENNLFKSLTSKHKLHSNTVYSLCKDASGNIWAVSNDEGILKYDGKSIKAINQKNGLRDEQPQQLFAYGTTLFALHSRGIDKINTRTDSVTYYDVFEGDLEPNLNAIGFDNSTFYSGTNNGVLQYRYAPQAGDTVKPTALITQLQINYRPFPIDSLQEFNPGQNNISLGFEGVWLKNPDKLSFRYRLQGFEDKWNYSSDGKIVNYNNLDAGGYAFIVQSRNEEDVWSRESSYSFTILAPIWKKWWFWTLVVVIGGSAIYFFLQYRLKNLQKENTLLEEKVKERTREIEKQSEIIEEKSKALELLSLVASRTDNVVLILDAEGRMEYVNESFVRLNKITLEELRKQGETIFEISNNPEIRSIVEDAVTNKHSVKYEALNKIDENTEVWEASTLTPIFNEQGELRKIIIIDSDVTESKRQERIIFQKNKDITDSIEYARKIQTAILPADALIKRYLPQSFVLYKTKDIVSGDFYWFAEKENCSVIAAVDCTGHGVPGAFMSLIGYNILNKIVNEQGQTDPGQILKELNSGVL